MKQNSWLSMQQNKTTTESEYCTTTMTGEEATKALWEAELPKHGAQLVAAETYSFDDLDVRTQLLKLNDQDLDVIVVIDATIGQLFKQVREVGIETALMSEWQIEVVPEGSVDRTILE